MLNRNCKSICISIARFRCYDRTYVRDTWGDLSLKGLGYIVHAHYNCAGAAAFFTFIVIENQAAVSRDNRCFLSLD